MPETSAAQFKWEGDNIIGKLCIEARILHANFAQLTAQSNHWLIKDLKQRLARVISSFRHITRNKFSDKELDAKKELEMHIAYCEEKLEMLL